MAEVIYKCRVIGDGKSLDTAFRPALGDLKSASGRPFLTYRVIEQRDGMMLVAADGDHLSAVRCVRGEIGTKPVEVVERDITQTTLSDWRRAI